MPSYPTKQRYYYANLSAEKGSTEKESKKKEQTERSGLPSESSARFGGSR